MSIVKTQKVSVYVTGSGINEAINLLQRSQIMELKKGERSLPESAVKGIEAELERVERAIDAVKGYRPRSGFFKKRRIAPRVDAETDKKHTEAARSCVAEILSCREQLSENGTQIEETDLRIRQCEAFAEFDMESFSEETKHVKACTLRGGNISREEFSEKMRGLPFYFEVISRKKRETIIFCAYLKRDAREVEEAFGVMGLSVPDFALAGRTPKEEIAECKRIKAELKKESEKLEDELIRLSRGLKSMELFYDKLLLKKERYSAFLASQNTEKVFVLSGYVPEKRVSELEKLLSMPGCVVEREEPDEGETLPVAFSNNAFVAPVEEVTASYSMPSAEDIDPNPVMSVFYYWFFGMMFSDAGYGLLLMAVCGFLGFSKILEKEKRSMPRMFFWCGVSTTLWGIAYGSFFGDLIGTVSSVFGKGDTAIAPVLIDPVNQALELLIIAIAFGLVHILTAMVIKFAIRWKKGDKSGAVYDIGSWIAVLGGLAAFAAGAALGADKVKVIGLVIGIMGVIIIAAMSGRDKKSVVKRIFSGVLSLYDITSFLGDILSYSRLMALGLATGVIASVVNVLAALGGSSPLGAVIFIAVSIFGHTLNFAINMLGAYVHTNRLQYVEFYQKFYEGGGKRFNPLRLKTKYFDFTEE